MFRWRANGKVISSISIITTIILSIIFSFVSFSPDGISSGNGVSRNAFIGNIIGRSAFTGPIVVYPSNNSVFSEPFNFRVDVYDDDFANITYQVEWMTCHLFMRNTSTMIDIDDWNTLSNGPHYIRFLRTDFNGGMLEAYLPFVKAALNASLIITHPGDLNYTVGTTGHNLNWILNCSNSSSRWYTIFRDSTLIDNNTWTPGVAVNCSVDGLPVGQYGYTINASDGQGETVQDLVIVTVVANNASNEESPYYEWNRTWGGASVDTAYAVWGDGTGNVYTCGYTMNFGADSLDSVLVKWNASGDVVWYRTWGGGNSDYANGVWGDSTGNIYMCGYTDSFGAGGFDMLLVKWNASGDVVWYRTWGGGNSDKAYAVWGDSAGDVYVCGHTMSFGAGGEDMVLVKWNASGDVLWNRTWGGTFHDRAQAIWGDDSGSVYTCGITESFGAGDKDVVLVKWDEAGNVSWYRTWGGLFEDWGTSLWGDDAGNVYTCGFRNFKNGGDYNILLIKWDAAGNILWYRTWGGESYNIARAVWGDSAGNVYACGYTYGYGAGYSDIVLVKWDVVGNVSWYRTWGGNSTDWGRGVWGDNEGYVYTCGDTSSFGSGNDDVVLVKWTTTLPSNQAPTITHPADITCTPDERGNISWVITSNNTGWSNYIIYCDGNIVANGSWTTSEPISVQIGELSLGAYNYTIVATNSLGLSVQDSVIVTVIISAAPTITHPADIICTPDERGNITWIISGNATGICIFIVYCDGIVVANGTWISDIPISIHIGTHPQGNHTYTIVATNGFGESVQDSVIVAVVPKGLLDNQFAQVLLGIIISGLTCAIITVYTYNRIRISKNKSELVGTKKKQSKGRYYPAEELSDNVIHASVDGIDKGYIVFDPVVLQQVKNLGLDDETENDLLTLLSSIASEERLRFLDEKYFQRDGLTTD